MCPLSTNNFLYFTQYCAQVPLAKSSQHLLSKQFLKVSELRVFAFDFIKKKTKQWRRTNKNVIENVKHFY